MHKAACVLVCLVLSSSLGLAQSDWNAVKAIMPGTALRVEVTRGRHAEGELQSVDDSHVIVLRNGTPITVSRAEVRKIERIGARTMAKRAVWGLLIGALGGTILGYSVTETNKGAWAARMAIGWGAIGSLIGAIDGLHARERVVVYQSP